ncbi:MAG: zeta toxin family protein [Prevotellaceae bacterium]|jgi:hypothetical protein|nr:zeta toxin family protein [Prevotellaceae bacterium]
MQLPETTVQSIYQLRKTRILAVAQPQEKPIAVILGGQPACGKSGVTRIESRDCSFLAINGDDYRQYHPEFQNLISTNPAEFPTITQNFSNVFTENLIKDGAALRYNLIIEGTMRNPDVPAKTAALLQEQGYRVGAAVIAAHPKITELGTYRRYVEQVEKVGYGRLADISSHNQACAGLLKSVDTLYDNKSVDFINIYSYQGERLLKSYELTNGEWNVKTPPSDFINKERTAQIENVAFVKQHIALGTEALSLLPTSPVKVAVQSLVKQLNQMSMER